MTGKLALKTAGASANAALATTIAAAALAAVDPVGSLGALLIKIHKASEPHLISVLDFQRGNITTVLQSSGNATVTASLLAAISGVARYKLVPDAVTGATSTGWTLKNNSDVVKSAPLGTFSPGFTPATAVLNSAAIDNSDPAAPFLISDAVTVTQGSAQADNRSALELALAGAIEPAESIMSLSQVIAGIEAALASVNKNGYMVVNDSANTFDVYVCANGTTTTVFQGAPTGSDANSLVGIYEVIPPNATTVAVKAII